MKKTLIIPLIFLFSLFYLLTCFYPSCAATQQTDILTVNRYLQPVEGSWYYEDRNDYIDFENYHEGAVPTTFNLVGTPSNLSKYGVFEMGGDNASVNPFLYYSYPYDKTLWLYPADNTSKYSVYFNLSEYKSLFNLQVEFMFIHAFVPGFNTTGEMIFSVILNDVAQFKVRLIPNYVGAYWYGRWSYWNGASWTYLYLHKMLEFSGVWYACYDVIFDYLFNVNVNLQVFNMTSNSTGTSIIDQALTLTGTLSGSSVDTTFLYIGGNYTQLIPIFLLGIDASSARFNYHENAMFYYTTKTYNAYNVEDIFTIHLPPPTAFQLSMYIENITIKSEMSKEEFLEFILVISGNQGNEQEFLDINSYQIISSSIYDDDVLMFYINVKYRCLSLASFNNTIYLKIIRFYTPITPGFVDLLLTAIPTILMLIVPSGVTYIKFKATGFLVVFFLMTLILTLVQLIPTVTGILMMIPLIILFLKIMQRNKEESE